MSTQQCPENYTIINTCYAYFLHYFNAVRSDFKKVTSPYLEIIKEISDPILQHISLYLVDNYLYAQPYFNNNERPLRNEACKNLNRWLDQRKSLFTYVGKCKSNVDLWDTYIEPLWAELKNNNKEKMCERHPVHHDTTTIPSEVLLSSCNKHVPDNYNCTEHSKITSRECENPPSERKNISIPWATVLPAKSFSPTVPSFGETTAIAPQIQSERECEVCPSVTNYIIISVGFTFLFTIFFLFFLFKFTSFLSCFHNRRMKDKMIMQDIVDEHTYEVVGRNSQNTEANFDNRRNYLLYSSMRN
ncbi:PIR Superfamily Protein [Plasmodium ovale wallikeri]|uniref:PIR Superfamily Protein n=1 Tax=Plasmodium ovale wallikeri TaxID=864142 RepID=A0A1A9APL3_PLAOA|nr:PIR Superfamily Protein [Plasmodium ovale wallikeri]